MKAPPFDRVKSDQKNVILSELLPPGSGEYFQPAASSSRPVPFLERVVQVSVGKISFSLPEYAVQKGLSDLRLATGECVSLLDYAQGVALVFVALARSGFLDDLASQLSHDPENQAIPARKRSK